MAKAGPLTDEVARRGEDPGFNGISKDDVREMLDHAQVLWNALKRDVTSSATLALRPYNLFYDTEGDVGTDVLRVIGAVHEDIDLAPTALFLLGLQNRKWSRETAGKPEQFCTVGRDTLVIHPGMEVASAVTILYDKITDVLVNDDATMEVRDEHLTFVTLLAELFFQVRKRNVPRIEELAEALGKSAGAT